MTCVELNTISLFAKPVYLDTIVLGNQILPLDCELNLVDSSIKNMTIFNTDFDSNILLPISLEQLTLLELSKCSDMYIDCSNCTEYVKNIVNEFNSQAIEEC